MNNIKERIKIFSGAQLKYIAFLSMLIDHTNKALIYPNLDGGALNRLSDFFDILGRIAFPIFIFLFIKHSMMMEKPVNLSSGTLQHYSKIARLRLNYA